MLLDHAQANVPYYKELIDGAGVTTNKIIKERSLEQIPLLDKATINQHKQELLATNISPRRLLPNSTGGSTGEPLRFYDDIKGSGMRYAAVWRFERWFGVNVGDRLASLWGANFDIAPYRTSLGAVRLWMLNRTMLPTWQLNPELVQTYIHRLVQYRPYLLNAYAGSLHQMAGMLGFKRQVIPDLRAIIVSAETLYEEWRLAIQETFGVPVYNRYAGRDMHTVAQECSLQKGLHIVMENVYVEIIKGGRPARPGELGEIVVTRLDNLAMPFIRYRTGDLGVMSDRLCSCGRGLPLLERVEGRLSDVIKTNNGSVVTGLMFAHLMKDFAEIKVFQVHQVALDHLILKLVTDPPGFVSDPEKMERIIKSFLGNSVRVDYEFCDEIPLTPTGKRRITISHLVK